jgi:hypothetical protein
MNCYFCQQPMPAKVMETANSYVATWSAYDCEPCQAHYEYSHESDEITHYRFTVENLSAYFYPRLNQFNLLNRQPPIGSSALLLTLHFLPNLTPTNLLYRYKTLLTFS